MHLVTVFAKAVGLIAWLVPGSSMGLIPQSLNELHLIRFLKVFRIKFFLIVIGFVLRVFMHSTAAFRCDSPESFADWCGVVEHQLRESLSE